jgi:hypothetical protein
MRLHNMRLIIADESEVLLKNAISHGSSNPRDLRKESRVVQECASSSTVQEGGDRDESGRKIEDRPSTEHKSGAGNRATGGGGDAVRGLLAKRRN